MTQTGFLEFGGLLAAAEATRKTSFWVSVCAIPFALVTLVLYSIWDTARRQRSKNVRAQDERGADRKGGAK
jgi:hypothetical protein